MISNGIEIQETRLSELWKVGIIQSADFRGSYMTFCRDDMFHELTGEHIVEGNLVDNHSGTFRGYHYSPRSWKLYLCLRGCLHYYLVNWDKEHPAYGDWQELTLQPYQGFIKHPRYATGMWSIRESTLLVLQSQYYDPENPDQQTFTRDDLTTELTRLHKRLVFYPDLPMVMSVRDTLGEYIFRRE